MSHNKTTTNVTLFAALLVILLLLDHAEVVSGRKKDHNVPHPHKGILTPYSPGPFTKISLTAKDEDRLKAGKSVMKQTIGQVAGGAICIQDVEAPRQAVWYQILDLDRYTKKVSKVVQSSNYCVQHHKDGSSTIKTKMVLGVMPGYSYESYYDHTFHPDCDSLIWQLDYDKTSDFDDVSGHWHIEPLSDERTRVFYACDIKLKSAVPGPVMNFIGKAALKQATSWVKREAEKNPDEMIPKAYLAFAKKSSVAGFGMRNKK